MKDFGEWLGELTQQLRGDSAPAEQAPVAPPAPPLPLVGGHTHTMSTEGYGDAGGHTHRPVPPPPVPSQSIPAPAPSPAPPLVVKLQGGPLDGRVRVVSSGQRTIRFVDKSGQGAWYEWSHRVTPVPGLMVNAIYTFLRLD